MTGNGRHELNRHALVEVFFIIFSVIKAQNNKYVEKKSENLSTSNETRALITENEVVFRTTVFAKDHRNEIEALDSVVKDLTSYKIIKRFDKKARLMETF